jgi:hypothetical protein
MAAVELPPLPKAADVTPRPIEAGGPLAAMIGSSVQTMDRLGDKWSIEVNPPSGAYSTLIQSARMTAKAQQATVVMVWPQPALLVPIGAPLVKGAGQLGTSLITDGWTPNIVLPPLRMVSFHNGVRHYIHQSTAQVVVSAIGDATLTLWPALRVSPADNLALEIIAAKIEGFIFSPADFGLSRRRHYSFPSFLLAEND